MLVIETEVWFKSANANKNRQGTIIIDNLLSRIEGSLVVCCSLLLEQSDYLICQRVYLCAEIKQLTK